MEQPAVTLILLLKKPPEDYNMNPLNSFYNNIHERESVKAFLIEILKNMAIDRAFEGGEVKGIKEAKECIDLAFIKLDELYGIIPEPIISNSR